MKLFPPVRILALLALASTLASGARSASADDTSLVITTDTIAYCGQLHDRVEAMMRAATVAPPPEVVDLTTQGERMCDHGLARGGILRLRRALSIMTQSGEEP